MKMQRDKQGLTSQITRVLVIGDPGSGKSGLIRSYVGSQPSEGFPNQKASDSLKIWDSSPLAGAVSRVRDDIKISKPQVVLICVDLSVPLPEEPKKLVEDWKRQVEQYAERARGNETKVSSIKLH
jgi:GTPase SAR1 family protein